MSEPITYTVQAADGQHYGPYPAANVQDWINEGRIKADQQMTRSDLKEWFRAGDFSEFVWTSAPVAAPAPAPAPAPVVPLPQAPAGMAAARSSSYLDPAAMMRIRSGANWFFWIAGLSAANLVLSLMGSNFGFAVGSSAFDLCVALSRTDGGFNLVPALGAGLVIGGWALIGVLARQANRWAFVVGLVLFALDTLLLLLLMSSNVIGLAIHGYILFRIFLGLKEAWALAGNSRG
ncbi:MAG TPA: GYF domain-containing protein [Candidatus Limnocylindria bacterium]|nr:GYF domain-containing protein [Candidatus Limnocylindria bacterium]